MTQFESLTVTISKREYIELLGKAFAFDSYSKVVTSTVDRGGYVTDMERGLFYKESKEIPAEEWEKIEALAEEKEEEDAETV